MKFTELAEQLEHDHETLKGNLKRAIAGAAKHNGGLNNLSREIGKSTSYIGNLVKQENGVASLLKGVQQIAAAYKAGKL